jgi:hypothetical protein
MRTLSAKPYSSNKGSALAIGLVILTAITLVSVTSMQRSGIQGRMVGNIQHQEQGFHAANGELEEIYRFYATQASATVALSEPLNNFDIINDEQVFHQVDPGHNSTYNSYAERESSNGQSSGHPPKTRLDVASNIQHTGERSSLVAGFSVGTFVEYGFVVTAESSEPSFGIAPGKTLSNQVVGIKYIAPAG